MKSRQNFAHFVVFQEGWMFGKDVVTISTLAHINAQKIWLNGGHMIWGVLINRLPLGTQGLVYWETRQAVPLPMTKCMTYVWSPKSHEHWALSWVTQWVRWRDSQTDCERVTCQKNLFEAFLNWRWNEWQPHVRREKQLVTRQMFSKKLSFATIQAA